MDVVGEHIKSLKETSAGKLAAMNAYFETQRTKQFPTYTAIFQDVHRIKRSVGAMTHVSGCDYSHAMRVYPISPSDLPTEVFIAVYPKVPPVYQQIPQIENIFQNHTPIRSSSKLLKREQNNGKESALIQLMKILGTSPHLSLKYN